LAQERSRIPPLTDVLLESASVGMCLIGPDGIIVRANSEWLRATGSGLEQVSGKAIVELFPDLRDLLLRAAAGESMIVPPRQWIRGGAAWEGSVSPASMEGGTGLLVTARAVRGPRPGGELRSVELGDVIEIRALQSLLEDFYKLVRMPTAILDTKGTILVVGAGWQEICTRFHRVHPETCNHCLESDTQLSRGVAPGEIRLYKCKNGMWDAATPIVVDGHHVGNLFTGQFFFEGEPLEYELFRSQAARYGFDQAAYLSALEAVPRLSRGVVAAGMSFLLKCADMLSHLGHSNNTLARSVAERETLMDSLQRSRESLEHANRRQAELLDKLSCEQAKLIESRSYLEKIIDSVADPIFVKDRQHRLVLINQALCRLLGRERASVIGKTDYDFLPKEEVDVFWEKDELVFSTGEENVNEEQLTDSRGVVHVIVTKKTLYVNERGEPFIVGIIRDVTEQRRLEEQLRQSQKMETLGVLASGVAHEINNPIAYVLSNLRFVSAELKEHESALPGSWFSQIKQVLDDALEGGERVRRIVQDLHTFARHSNRRGPVDIHRVLDLAINIASNQIRYRATLVKDYADIPPVQGDESRLGQVVLNLIVNAAQAIPEGRPSENEIRVTTRQDSAGRVVLEVRDTGSGIPHEIRSRVFDPFFTTKPIGSGTGLGLSICHGIVTSLGGEISVESTLGKGTTFRVVLPVAPAA
jgi:PAS domain S-box-containing protein